MLAESWVQGSLPGGVQKLYADHVVTNATLLLIDDIPNCDMYPSDRPCATGALTTDINTWGSWIKNQLKLDHYAVWDAVDGGTADTNYYGDLHNNGSSLTAKGLLHRARARAFWNLTP